MGAMFSWGVVRSAAVASLLVSVVACSDQGTASGTGSEHAGGAGGSGVAAAMAPALCSGCSTDIPDKMDTQVHLHHVHLNTADEERSKAFYEKELAAKRVHLNGATEALNATPILLLHDHVMQPPRAALPTALQHIGWGSEEPAAWFAKAQSDGVVADTRGNTLFATDGRPAIGAPGSGATNLQLLGVQPPACFPVPDRLSYIYVLGPDQERIEIWSGIEQRVNHLHFTTANLTATMDWYEAFFGLKMVGRNPLFAAFYLDDILFFFEPIGAPDDYSVTDDHVMGHFALAVSDLDAWVLRAQELKVEIVAQPAEVHGFRSFFVRGPDGMLIELVQASPSKAFCTRPMPSNAAQP